MKFKLILLLNLIITSIAAAQQQELTFPHQNINFSAPPRTSLSPMSVKLWDNYKNGGPTTFGTVLEIYGFVGHQTGQLYFGGWDNSKIRYREAFYAQTAWSDWMTLLDSKNNVESSGLLMLTGQGNHYISQGNLGIGTTTPVEKLSVNGKIRAQEIKVETANWPDYVFEPDYKVLDLQELDTYIKVNKHLPDMPSAKEVEANGVALGELVKLQQKKIEELTIYLIEQNKQITLLKSELKKTK